MPQHKAIILYTTMEGAEKSKERLDVEDVEIFPAATLNDVQGILEETPIDVVLLGCELKDLASRLKIIEYVKTWSYRAGKGPSIHFLGSSQPDDQAFIYAVLKSDLLR